jgi:hypothetical protein
MPQLSSYDWLYEVGRRSHCRDSKRAVRVDENAHIMERVGENLPVHKLSMAFLSAKAALDPI